MRPCVKIRSLAALSIAAFAILAASTGAAAEPAAKPETAPAEKTEPATKGDTAKGKPVLDKGMDADTIIKHYGKPYEIKPVEIPEKDTKVERWIYRRKVKETTVQTASGQTMVPTYSGFSGTGVQSISEVAVPEYRLKHVIVYQVTELLMINDKLKIAKQWMGQEEKYD